MFQIFNVQGKGKKPYSSHLADLLNRERQVSVCLVTFLLMHLSYAIQKILQNRHLLPTK